MIRIKGRAAVYGEVWFDEEPPSDSGVDIILYQQVAAPIPDAQCTPSLTLVSDLSVGEDAIADKFGKDCRYKIRRADTKDGLSMEFIVDPENRLDEFRAFYDSFAGQKSLDPCHYQWLVAACRAHRLTLTSASRYGEALVWHAYVMCGKAVRMEYSGSLFRDRENEYRALVGRANRWLHWRDMLRFKEIGIERYDWGGLIEDDSIPERDGLNSFKMSFGGQQVRTYGCAVPVTIRGRMYLPLRDAWYRLKKVSHEFVGVMGDNRKKRISYRA